MHIYVTVTLDLHAYEIILHGHTIMTRLLYIAIKESLDGIEMAIAKITLHS